MGWIVVIIIAILLTILAIADRYFEYKEKENNKEEE